jgi:hypothetical protein
MGEELNNIAMCISEAFKTLLTKLAGRKFITFVIATHMTYLDILDAQNWMLIAMLFIGIQTALDWKGINGSQNSKPPETEPTDS